MRRRNTGYGPSKGMVGRRGKRLRDISFVVGLVVLVAGAYLVTRWHQSRASTSSSPLHAVALPTTAPASSTGSTSTTIAIQFINFQPGDCVIWDQTSDSDPLRTADTVSCSKAHLVEIVQGIQQIAGLGPQFPTDAQMSAYTKAHCTAPAEHFFGRPIDPYGRFTVSAITPVESSWDEGFRSMSCDIQLQSLTGPTRVIPTLTGEVRGASQTLLLPVGTCESFGSSYMVPCTKPHTDEVTGNVELAASVTTMPTTNAGWYGLIGTSCHQLGLTYLGGSYPSGVESGWRDLPASSWAAGQRTVQCIVGRPNSSYTSWTPFSGSLKPPAH